MSERPLSRRDQLKLKAYDSLNLWNDNESKVNLRLDALAISVIGIIAYAVSKQKLQKLEGILLVIFSVLILVVWLVLCWKYSKRVIKRFELMQEIECDLGFSAHRRMADFIKDSWWQRNLTHFVVRCIIGGIIVGTLGIAVFMHILSN